MNDFGKTNTKGSDMLSDKWISVDAIIERTSRVFPNLEIPRSSAAEWCFDVVKEVGVFPSFEEKTAIVEVRNGQAVLPCDVYRILHIRPGSMTSSMYRTEFRENWYVENLGRVIDVNNHNRYGSPKTIEIEYLAFVVDESGYPMIFVEAAEAAMFYLIMKMKTADYVNGDMKSDRFLWVQSQYEDNLSGAKSKTMRWTTREDLDKIVRVARSIVRPMHYAAK
jgi:hypothetical protein